MTATTWVYDTWSPQRQRERDRDIAAEHRDCPACGAKPGQPCDGTRIPRFELLHFARRQSA